MAKVKNTTNRAIEGAGLTYYAVKKSGKVSKMWQLLALSAVGAVVGAMAQSKMSAMSSTPK